MIQRVRAVLTTQADTVLMIKRVRPEREPYWVLPGGHVEPADPSLEAALHREIKEELAVNAEVLSLCHVLEEEDQRQLFYLCKITGWDFSARSGGEFSEQGRGTYALEEIPLTTEGLSAINLLPPEIASVLREAVAKDELFQLPDLRQSVSS